MDQYIGRLLDNRYEILEVIGTGGMAVVYKARCHRLNRLVAIKILKDEYARDEEFRRRFHAEGEAVAMLSHPNIVQVYDVSSTDDANFIVMELIDGISLKQYMEAKGVLNWKETLHFAMQIAKGLEHAHSRGIVHRDIKPHNVMVLKNGSVKVMDFGIARVMSKSNTLTKEALGSVHYISPEQAKGGHTDNRADIYSLSVVMYEMMTGRPPYDGESPVAVAIQHINGGAVRPSVLNPNIPAGLEQIILKGMSLEVRDRYVSATEMLQDMEAFRQNPAIRFNYHSLVDDATRVLPVVSQEALTTAEKKVQVKTGETPPRQNVERTLPEVQAKEHEAIRRAQQRRQTQVKQMEQQKKEERSRVATTAIVVCSFAAVAAILLFLLALFNGSLLNQEKELTDVPYLVGSVYTDDLDSQYGSLHIKLQPQQYSGQYRAGQIISQEPVGGSKVVKGSDLWITISLGPEPEKQAMPNFVGSNGEEAKKILVEKDFVPVVKNEPSYVYDVGLVTRTEPAADAELVAGQTVYLYVSSGPDVIMAKMPYVVGLELSRAKELLDQQGFTNVEPQEVESQKEKGMVVSQSVEKNKEVDVTTKVVLQVSMGPEATEATEESETTIATGGDDPVSIAFSLPEREEPYILSIFQDGKEVVESREIQPGTITVSVPLSGVGTIKYDLWIDGEYYRSQTVEFTNDD